MTASSFSRSRRKQMAAQEKRMDEMRAKPTPIQAIMYDLLVNAKVIANLFSFEISYFESLLPVVVNFGSILQDLKTNLEKKRNGFALVGAVQ